MDKQIQSNTEAVAEEARALLAVTGDLAGERVEEARRRLAAALERGKEICGKVREKVVEGAKTTDEAVLKHPYQAIGIALGAGALLGFLVTARHCRHCRNHD